MCDWDGDLADFDVRRYVKARKAHDCFAYGCDINIRPGDIYHETVCGNRGELPQRFKHCLWDDGAEFIDYALNCGETWQDARSGSQPDQLAFMTAYDAQLQLMPANVRATESYGKNG